MSVSTGLALVECKAAALVLDHVLLGTAQEPVHQQLAAHLDAGMSRWVVNQQVSQPICFIYGRSAKLLDTSCQQ